MNLFYMLFWLFVVLLAMYLFFKIGEYSSEKDEQNNNENNYKKEISDEDIIECLDRIDRAYVGCVKVLVKALMDIEPISDKRCYKFEAAIFVLFQLQYYLKITKKVPHDLIKSIVVTATTHLSSISSYKEEWLENRLKLYQELADRITPSKNFYSDFVKITYNMFLSLFRRAASIDSWFGVGNIKGDEFIHPAGIIDSYTYITPIQENIIEPMLFVVDNNLKLLENMKHNRVLYSNKDSDIFHTNKNMLNYHIGNNNILKIDYPDIVKKYMEIISLPEKPNLSMLLKIFKNIVTTENLKEINVRNMCGAWDYNCKYICKQIDVLDKDSQYDLESRDFYKYIDCAGDKMVLFEYFIFQVLLDNYTMAYKCPPYHHHKLIFDKKEVMDILQKYKDAFATNNINIECNYPILEMSDDFIKIGILISEFDGIRFKYIKIQPHKYYEILQSISIKDNNYNILF